MITINKELEKYLKTLKVYRMFMDNVDLPEVYDGEIRIVLEAFTWGGGRSPQGFYFWKNIESKISMLEEAEK